jgi:S1-C subfamily serine protease
MGANDTMTIFFEKLNDGDRQGAVDLMDEKAEMRVHVRDGSRTLRGVSQVGGWFLRADPGLQMVPGQVREMGNTYEADLLILRPGVAIIDVQAGSVADKAGLVGSTETINLDEDFEVPAPGDLIVAIDGQAVDSVEDIAMKVTYESQAGDELNFTILRDGVEINVAVTLEVAATNAIQAAD